MKKQLKKSLLVMFSILGLAVPTITVGFVALVSCSSNDQNNPSDTGGSDSGGSEVKPPVVDNYNRRYLEFSANIPAPKSFVDSVYLDKNINHFWYMSDIKWFEDDGTPITYVTKITIDQPIYLASWTDVDVNKPINNSGEGNVNFWRLMDLSEKKPLVIEYEAVKETNDDSKHDFSFQTTYRDQKGQIINIPYKLNIPNSSFGEAVYFKDGIITVPNFYFHEQTCEFDIEYFELYPHDESYQKVYDDYKESINKSPDRFYIANVSWTSGGDFLDYRYYTFKSRNNNADYIGKLEIYPKNKK